MPTQNLEFEIRTNFHSALPLEQETMLFREELALALRFVWETCERARSISSLAIEDELAEHRMHQNLGILGGRGAGKTSFLLTFLKLLQDDSAFRTNFLRSIGSVTANPYENGLGKTTKVPGELLDQLARKVVIAGLIEPSLLDSDDHLVAAVYAKLLERARRKIRKNPPIGEREGQKFERFMRAAQRVTELLPVLFSEDRLHQVFKQDGAEGLHDEITQFRNGFNLERAMWSFIDAYLELEEKELVVLAIDDIDLALEHGINVLESLRRYLTSPQMLIVVTGDPDLFHAVLKNHFKRHDISHPLSEEMIAQYQKKLLPNWMRIYLPKDAAEGRLEKIKIVRRDRRPEERSRATHEGNETKQDRISKESDEEIAFVDHYAMILAACLRTPDAESERKVALQKATKYYRFLIPRELRRFLELCSIDIGSSQADSERETEPRIKDLTSRAEKERVLFDFSKIWNDRLLLSGLDHWRLREFAHDRRIGLKVLNHLLLRRDNPDELILRLDLRTDKPDLNLSLAFLRFALESQLDHGKLRSVLAVGIDFCAMTHYLRDFKATQILGAFHHELGLHLLDSQRKLFGRLVPWLAQPGRRVRAGVVPLTSRVAALETFLDLQDASQTAAWRWILGDPQTTSLPSWLTGAALRCREFFEQKPGWSRIRDTKHESDAGGESNKLSSGTEACWREISGYLWATRYLPDLLAPGAQKNIFSKRWPRSASPCRPLISECVNTERSFHQYAGALPRLILRCWTIHDGKHCFLSPWQNFTLIQRSIDIVVDHYASWRRSDGWSSLQSIDRKMIMSLRASISECLREHLEVESGAAPAAGDVQEDSLNLGIGETLAMHDHTKAWGQLLAESRAIQNPELLFPDLSSRQIEWKAPPMIEPSDDSLEDALERARAGEIFCDWFMPPSKSSETGEEDKSPRDTKSLPDWNRLLAAQLRAWEEVRNRLAMAITEWALYWLHTWEGEESSGGWDRIQLTEVQDIFDTFLTDLSEEERFVDQWSGAGDIIQRWTLAFLNAVLIKTLRPPKSSAGSSTDQTIRPSLNDSRHHDLPGRATQQTHPLFQNLRVLDAQKRRNRVENHGVGATDGLTFSRLEQWHPSLTFLSLASFPTLGMFVSDGDPLPRATNVHASAHSTNSPKSAAEWVGNRSGDDPEILDLQCIVRLGKLMLIPLPGITYYSEDASGTESPPVSRWRLDLSGLSWCGLPLRCADAKKKTKDGFQPPILGIFDRRNALISMLNSVAADVVDPVKEAQPHRAPLALAVLTALTEKQEMRLKALDKKAEPRSKGR